MSKKISAAEKKRRKAEYEKKRYQRNKKRILKQQSKYYKENKTDIRKKRKPYWKVYNKRYRKEINPETDKRFKAVNSVIRNAYVVKDA
jgi:hypothetical protein|tara:strand:- start:738 stop:1001 length:264 start_codon:yes stop_codon:yes gene_type:complete